MLSLHQSVSSLLLLSTLTAISYEELTPVHNEESSAEGSTVTLSYNSSTVNTGDYFYWYRQYPGQAPEFLLSQFTSGQDGPAPTSGLRIKVEQNQIHMIISSAAVTDSAVHYCALMNVAGNKMVFGSGTRLTIEPRDDYEPSYYELEDEHNTTRACLATGFSRNNATLQNPLFLNPAAKTRRAVRAPDESLHSEVVLMQKDDPRGKCELDPIEPVDCVDALDKDVTVNTVSLLVVALRLLFLKTVVFNVLMTLRLWLSH